MTKHRDLFSKRQLTMLTTFSDLIMEVRDQVLTDAERAESDWSSGDEARAHADAIATYLAFAVDRTASMSSALCWWNVEGFIAQTFARPTLSMVWDFAESNPLGDATGNWMGAIEWIANCIKQLPAREEGAVIQRDVSALDTNQGHYLISTDPPYYDNIGYADLSDFFYIWLRRSLYRVYPDLFTTLLVPKAQELIATPYRFDGSRAQAQKFFEDGLSHAFARIRSIQPRDYPLTLYYAFKQSESETDGSGAESGGIVSASTGWETMLEGLLRSGMMITGTWPSRTERSARPRDHGSNALASSIVLVCRLRPDDARLATRRDFLAALKRELPEALRTLQHGNIAPVDLAQAAIGPGMAVFSRYSRVIESDGKPMRVRTALQLINQMLDEVLAEQEAEHDADTRWAIAWYEQYGHDDGPYGIAEMLSKAKVTSVNRLAEAGVIASRAGKVRLLRRDELDADWNPLTDYRRTVWETTQHLIRVLDAGGELAAATILRQVGAEGEMARDLAYRLYTTCERKGWAAEALAYNTLVIAWPELVRQSGETPAAIGQLPLV
ncbi:MAG: hypothetical protein M3Q65_01985 [Chloroflexota bacterium]|nr:hypothetical protein [Chloroflexota bacterium]